MKGGDLQLSDITEGNGRNILESIDAAIAEQHRLRDRVLQERVISTADIRAIAGADASYTDRQVIGVVVVLSILSKEEHCCAESRVPNVFPYIPGLFAFREGGAILSALQKLSCCYDLLMLHGHGYAHPRHCGIASHLGVLLDRPSIGIADRLLVGTAEIPGPERGALSPVREGGEVIGMAVRTREGSRPVFVSVGHRTDLEQAVEVVLATTGVHRMPEPIRIADRRARSAMHCAAPSSLKPLD
jgi:deoxyribonuclease V